MTYLSYMIKIKQM